MATPDVLVLIFWPGALEFKILKFLFSCCLYIFFGNFPRFSVHKSLKILEKYIANFFKGYMNYLRTNQTSSQVHLVPCVHLQFTNSLEKQTSKKYIFKQIQVNIICHFGKRTDTSKRLNCMLNCFINKTTNNLTNPLCSSP